MFELIFVIIGLIFELMFFAVELIFDIFFLLIGLLIILPLEFFGLYAAGGDPND